MNTVLEDAVEVDMKRSTRRPIGRIVLKGDNIALICNISAEWNQDGSNQSDELINLLQTIYT